MREFFEMSGYAGFVWSAYAIAIAGWVLNAWLARRLLRRARTMALRKLAMQDPA